MRVEVDPEICEGHGLCNAVAPEVYGLDDDGYAVVRVPEPGPDLAGPARDGASSCPVQAITVTG